MVSFSVISSRWVYERRSLVFVSAADVAEKIHSGTLEAWAESVKEELGRSNHVTLMVYDFNNYFRQGEYYLSISPSPGPGERGGVGFP